MGTKFNEYDDTDIELQLRNEDTEDEDNILQVDEYDDKGKFKKSYGKKNKKPTLASELLSYVIILLTSFLLALFISNYILMNSEVPTGSMYPTIHENDRIFGFRLAYMFDDPKFGDIIIFKFPDDESEIFVKRVIGVPGDVIEFKDASLYVNGKLIVESYINQEKPMGNRWDGQVYIVPEDSYFVLGDNRNNSKDSREWVTTNYVTKDKILAKAIFRYYSGSSNSISFKSLLK